LDALPADDPGRGGYLSDLGTSLQARFLRLGHAEDLDAAIEVGRAAVSATVPAEHRSTVLGNLSNALRLRAERTGDPRYCDDAVRAAQEAVRTLLDDAQARAPQLVNLAAAHRQRHVAFGSAEDVDLAVAEYRDALDLARDPQARRMASIGLGGALTDRFVLRGALDDLDAAVAAARAGVAGGGPAPATASATLAVALRERHRITGHGPDLADAVLAARAAVTAADGSARAVHLAALGNVLHDALRRWGEAVLLVLQR